MLRLVEITHEETPRWILMRRCNCSIPYPVDVLEKKMGADQEEGLVILQQPLKPS